MIDTIINIIEATFIGICCLLIIALIGGAAYLMFGLCGVLR
jgi:hypothetical protein